MKKIALAPCNGMSPNGLVSRVAVGDVRNENEEVISICMGSTSADIEGANDKMLRKNHIIAINGCSGGCVNKILSNKNIDIAQTINIGDVLENYDVAAKDPFRLDGEAEECVKIIKNEINNKINQIKNK